MNLIGLNISVFALGCQKRSSLSDAKYQNSVLFVSHTQFELFWNAGCKMYIRCCRIKKLKRELLPTKWLSLSLNTLITLRINIS